MMARRLVGRSGAPPVLRDMQEVPLERTVVDLTVGGRRITGLSAALADPGRIRVAMDDFRRRQ